MIIKVNKRPNGKQLYPKSEFTLNPGLTIVIGHNGSGKSTLLKLIKHNCDVKGIPCFNYDNYAEGGSAAHEKYGFKNDFDALSNTLFHSEGEQLFYNFGKIAEDIGSFLRSNVLSDKMFILLDALDSGLDVEGIEQVKDMCKLILKQYHKKEVYILITANSYSFVHKEQCFDVVSYTNQTFDTFESYREFILNQYKRKRSKK